MSLVCNICQSKGKYRVVIDMGRFTHRFYYCEEHKPLNFQLELMDEKQHDEGEIIMQDKFAESTLCECGHLKEDHCSTDSRDILNHCELCNCKVFRIQDKGVKQNE